MPRKVSPGPIIKRIELMSTGREWRPDAGVDDFTGLPIERAQDNSPIRDLPSAQELRDRKNRVKRITLQRIARELFEPKVDKPFKRRI